MGFGIRNANIHLVLANGGSKAGIESSNESIPFDHTSINFIERTSGIVNITKNEETILEANALGEDFVRIEFGAEQLVFRVRVHQDFERLWLGNDSITMYNEEDNYILSAFAKFDDGLGKSSVGECSIFPAFTIPDPNPSTASYNEYSIYEPFNKKSLIAFGSNDSRKVKVGAFGRLFAYEETTEPVIVEVFPVYNDDAHVALKVIADGIVDAANTTVGVMDPGASYSALAAPDVRLFGGSGYGATATANVNGGGEITGLTFIDGGSGYKKDDIIHAIIYRNSPSDAKAIAATDGDGISSITIDASIGGSGYLEAPEVIIVGGNGEGAKATAVITGGVVTSFIVDNVGSGYTSSPQVFIREKDHTVEVTVLESLSSLKQEIIRTVHTGSSTSDKYSMLIIGEGFSNDTDFDSVVQEMVKKNMLGSKIYRPYEYLKDYLDVYSVNLPCAADGITCANRLNDSGTFIENTSGSPTVWNMSELCPRFPTQVIQGVSSSFYTLDELIKRVGIPYNNTPANLAAADPVFSALDPSYIHIKLHQKVFDAWIKLEAKVITQVKDTLVGHGTGAEVVDPSFTVNTNSFPGDLPFGSWYQKNSYRDAVIGIKRRSLEGNDKFKEKLLLSLKFGTDPANSLYNISSSWTKYGKNEGLVGFILNETNYAGTQAGNSFAAALGKTEGFAILKRALPYDYKFDNFPNHVSSANTGRHLPTATRIMAHEMGHSTAFEILDEYEGADGNTGPITEFEDLNEVDFGSNVTTLRKVELHSNSPGNKKVHPARIKWNWHRVELASRITGSVTNVTPDKVIVPVSTNEVSSWLQVQADGREVVLRTSELNPHLVNSSLRTAGDEFPLTIHGIDVVTGAIILIGGQIQTGDFEEGSHIYIPLMAPSSISEIVVETAGIGYTKKPKIEIIGGNNKAKAKVDELVSGGLDNSQISLKNPGANFSKRPIVKVIHKDKDAPTEIAILKANIEPVNTGILYIRIKEKGGYDTPPTINILGGGPGGSAPITPAVVTAHLSNKVSLVSITLVSGGSGYIPSPYFTITGGGGTGARIKAGFWGDEVKESRIVVEDSGVNYSNTALPIITLAGVLGTIPPVLTAVVTDNGWIKSVIVDPANPGSGFGDPKDMYLIINHPNGLGARARAVVNTGGVVTQVIVEQPGQGYNNTDLTAELFDSRGYRRPAGTLSSSSFDGNGGLSLTANDVTWTPPTPDPDGYFNSDYYYRTEPLRVIITDFDGVDMGAVIEPTVDTNGTITDLKVIYPGDGYSAGASPFKVEILGGRAGGQPKNTMATATPVVLKTLEAIEVLSTNRGSGYLSVPKIQISSGGGIGGAVAVAELEIYDRLIAAPVFDYIQTNQKALTVKTSCDIADSGDANPPAGLGPIYPTFRPYLVGLYEGGGTWNCETYRPTGTSTMRTGDRVIPITNFEGNIISYSTVNHRFNYPCRYYMVTKLAPSNLALLDTDMQKEFKIF